MSFKDLIQQAKSEELQEPKEKVKRKTVKPVLQKAVNLDDIGSDDIVSLTIKVDKARRTHWLIEAKRKGSSLTQEIINFLSQKYGEPE